MILLQRPFCASRSYLRSLGYFDQCARHLVPLFDYELDVLVHDPTCTYAAIPSSSRAWQHSQSCMHCCSACRQSRVLAGSSALPTPVPRRQADIARSNQCTPNPERLRIRGPSPQASWSPIGVITDTWRWKIDEVSAYTPSLRHCRPVFTAFPGGETSESACLPHELTTNAASINPGKSLHVHKKCRFDSMICPSRCWKGHVYFSGHA